MKTTQPNRRHPHQLGSSLLLILTVAAAVGIGGAFLMQKQAQTTKSSVAQVLSTEAQVALSNIAAEVGTNLHDAPTAFQTSYKCLPTPTSSPLSGKPGYYVTCLLPTPSADFFVTLDHKAQPAATPDASLVLQVTGADWPTPTPTTTAGPTACPTPFPSMAPSALPSGCPSDICTTWKTSSSSRCVVTQKRTCTNIATVPAVVRIETRTVKIYYPSCNFLMGSIYKIASGCSGSEGHCRSTYASSCISHANSTCAGLGAINAYPSTGMDHIPNTDHSSPYNVYCDAYCAWRKPAP